VLQVLIIHKTTVVVQVEEVFMVVVEVLGKVLVIQVEEVVVEVHLITDIHK
jgi:hypothetical protein